MRKRLYPPLPGSLSTLALLCAAVGGSPSANAQTVGDLAKLSPGPFRVGFHAEFVVDPSRKYFSDSIASGRPLRLFVWYPSEGSGGEPLLFRSYLDVIQAPRQLAMWSRALSAADSNTTRRQFSQADKDSAFARLLGLPTWSVRGAPAPGKFPLLIHSLGLNDYQLESTALWELLASHGYVVAVIPQLGQSSDAPRSRFGKATIELQAADVEFALGWLKRRDEVDSTRIGLIGHSIGGAVALVVASRHPEVSAIVSLDGSGTTTDGKAALDSIDWHARRIHAPLLNMHRLPQPKLDLSIFDALSSRRRYDISLTTATHFDFQNWPVYAPLSTAPDTRSEGFRPPVAGRDFFNAVARLTLDFLNRELKGQDGTGELVSGRRTLGTGVDTLVAVRVIRRPE